MGQDATRGPARDPDERAAYYTVRLFLDGKQAETFACRDALEASGAVQALCAMVRRTDPHDARGGTVDVVYAGRVLIRVRCHEAS